MTEEKLVFVGTLVTSNSSKLMSITSGFLVAETGKITKLGSKDEFLKMEQSGEFKDFTVIKLSEGQFLMPGLVDCHTHAPQFPNIGLGLDRPLLEWLDKYTFPLESQYGDVKFAASVYDQVVKRLLTNGTTTACYFGSIHLEGTLELVKSASNHRQRALVGKCSMNVKNDAGYFNETRKELADVEAFVRKVQEYQVMWDNDLVMPVVTPRFAVSCDRELLSGLSRIAEKYQCRIQSHISENHDEIKYVLGSNPDCKSYSEVYDKCQILNKKCIMAHAVHLSPAEMSLLAARGVSIAHCPASNTRLRSGLCPVRELLDANVTVGLGTDVSGGDSASILDAMRRCMDVSAHLSMLNQGSAALDWAEAFYLATLGGAEALNLEDKIGSLEVGKELDALVIDVFAAGGPINRYANCAGAGQANEAILTDHGNMEDLTGLVQRFVYLGDDRNIARVFVKGVRVK